MGNQNEKFRKTFSHNSRASQKSHTTLEHVKIINNLQKNKIRTRVGYNKRQIVQIWYILAYYTFQQYA